MQIRWSFLLAVLLPALGAAQGRAPLQIQKPYAVESADTFRFQSFEDDHGGFYLVWPHTEGPQTSLRGQHIDNQGNLLWTDPGVDLVSGLDAGLDWEATADTHGGMFLSWGNKEHVFMQRFGPDAKPLWPADTEAVSDSTSSQKLPVLTAESSGGAYVVWQEKFVPDRWVLMIQRISSQGAPLWHPGGIRVSLRPSDQQRPHIVYDGAGGTIIAWNDFRAGASQLQVQRLDYQGNRLWGLEGLLITAPAGDPAKRPYLAAVGSGAGVVAWKSSSSANNRIFLQLIDANGKFVWDPGGLELSHGPWNEWNPVLHGDGQGGTWVGWEDYRNDLNWQVFIEHLQTSGRSDWVVAETALTTARADQGRLGLTDDGQGGMLAAWVDNRLGSVGVYAQEVTGRGQLTMGDGFLVANGLTNPPAPQIVYLAPGQAAVSWADNPSKGAWALYWKRLGPQKP